MVIPHLTKGINSFKQKKTTMKNVLKFGFLALVITVFASACGGSSNSNADSENGDTAVVLDNDSAGIDSTVVIDSLK